MKKPLVGLLPFYIALYDEALPDLINDMEPFIKTISDELISRDIVVEAASVCRLKSDFEKEIHNFEQIGVDAIITLHLAYSPSLESADAISGTFLPVIILDTTPTFDFGPGQDSIEILYNHGIHGVQDLCNILIRRGKKFRIVAGHWQQSDVIDRAVNEIKACSMMRNYRESRIGIIGSPFTGMGDFAVSDECINEILGFKIIKGSSEEISEIIRNISNDEIITEEESITDSFAHGKFTRDSLRNSAVAGLALRKWITNNNLSGLSVNFLDIDRRSNMPCVPFLEISKSMARGIGYAGEGDVLTASLVSALLQFHNEVSFVEMFCPDWKNNSIFLSHMGEANLSLFSSAGVISEINFPYTDAENPLVAHGAFREGEVVLVNLAPAGEKSFRLLIAKGKMLEAQNNESMNTCIRGWFKPDAPVIDFLEIYSSFGGTHHSVLVYNSGIQLIKSFGEQMGWQVINVTAIANSTSNY